MATTSEETPQGTGQPVAVPKFKQIQDVIAPNGELANAAKAQSEAMGKIGSIYKKIEKDLLGNRQAVALIVKLQKMSADKRNDFIRTLEPLLVEFGYTLDVIDPQDLIPTNTPPHDPNGGGAPADDGDSSGGEPAAAPAENPLSKAKQHLTGAPASSSTASRPKLGMVAGGRN